MYFFHQTKLYYQTIDRSSIYTKEIANVNISSAISFQSCDLLICISHHADSNAHVIILSVEKKNMQIKVCFNTELITAQVLEL